MELKGFVFKQIDVAEVSTASVYATLRLRGITFVSEYIDSETVGVGVRDAHLKDLDEAIENGKKIRATWAGREEMSDGG